MEEKPTYIATDGTVFDTEEECLEHNKATKKWILSDTRLYDMLDKDIESISDYIKTGRQFWMYNDKTDKHDLITVTDRRGNVAFYKKDGYDVENAFFVNTAGACFLYPRHIYVDDIAKHLVKKGSYSNYDDAYDDACKFYRDYGLYVPDGCEIEIIT